ncbi:MAG: DUF4293 domain-containing protein [Muribaculaceae bacterium]|nr:DUF4293 domain-containing protein [Muribaculaceae bacterium]
MVIQRWQTVFLLIAAIMAGIFSFSTVAVFHVGETVNGFQPADAPVYLTVNILIALLLVLCIFMYRNLRRQMLMTLVSIVLVAASMVSGGFIIYGGMNGGGTVELVGADLLLLGTAIFALLAYRRMGRDRKLLSSYDSLR